jgi:hypothetical protein
VVPAGVPAGPGGSPEGGDALSAAGGGAAGAGFAGLALLVLAGLAVPGLARIRRMVVVPSTAAIVSLHEVPG